MCKKVFGEAACMIPKANAHQPIAMAVAVDPMF